MYRLYSNVDFSTVLACVFSMFCAYFESTQSFMFALLLGFFFNIVAGLRADSVSFRMWRLCNFKGYKLKDSLIELLLIIITTYFLKELVELMGEQNAGVYVVQWLVWVALYYYVRNGLRNMSLAYPKNRWVRFVYYLISFHFNKMMPDAFRESWEKSASSDLKEE